jgi:hypothetical protein
VLNIGYNQLQVRHTPTSMQNHVATGAHNCAHVAAGIASGCTAALPKRCTLHSSICNVHEQSAVSLSRCCRRCLAAW